jgi:hypothetical protein
LGILSGYLWQLDLGQWHDSLAPQRPVSLVQALNQEQEAYFIFCQSCVYHRAFALLDFPKQP